MKITDCIVCPQCQLRFLGKSASPKLGSEYFCHKCHSYFGLDELVNEWGYDLGDFCDIPFPVDTVSINEWTEEFNELAENSHTISSYEPLFYSAWEREQDYEVVTRMFLDIPEWSMENNEVDTGALHL